MLSKLLLKIIKVLVFAVIVLTPVFYMPNTIYPAVVSKTALFQAIVEAAFFLWLALAASDRKYRPKFTPLFSCFAVFLAVLVLSSSLGVDPWRSFWSTYERMFGVVTILHLAALAVVIYSIFSRKDARSLLWASVAASSLVAGIAIAQTQFPKLITFENLFSSVAVRPGSTLDNPSYLAGYLIFNFFFAAYLLLEKYTNKNGGKNGGGYKAASAAFLLLAMFMNIYALLIAQTRGAILGWVAGLFVLIALFAVRPPDFSGKRLGRSVYAAVIALIIFAGAGFWFTRHNSFWSRVPGLSRFKDISFSFSGEFGPRLIATRAASRGFLDRPILGWGEENFNIVFNKYYDPKALEFHYQETRFDKPHNFFMEYLVAGGALLALCFLALAVAFIWESWRGRNKIFGHVAIAAFVAYAVQNLFLFDTLGPALMLYMLIGLVGVHYETEGQKGPECQQAVFIADEAQSNNIKPGVVAIFAAVAAGLIFFVNILTVAAAYDEYWGFQYLANGRVREGVDYFHKSLDTWSPYRWNFVRDYATAMSQAYFYNNNGGVPADEVRWSIAEMEKVRDERPLDAFNHYLLVDVYNQSSAIDPADYLAKAEREADIALRLSPNRQEVYFSLAKTNYLEGKPDKALAILKQALELDPSVPDAHFYYGIMAFAVHDTKTGYSEIEQSIKMGRQWAIFYEPRTVAGLFADNGHPEEAIKIYEEALGLQPRDTETQLKLGLAYYVFDHDKDKARELLLRAAQNFNFSQSPLYQQIKPILDDLGVK